MANTSSTFQAYLNGLLMGRSTNYPIVDYQVSMDIISHDSPRPLANGEYQGPQFSGPIYVDFTFNVAGTTEALLYAHLDTLATAWAPQAANVLLELNVPQDGARTLSGRPYKFEPPTITANMRTGLLIMGVRAQFKAGTPTWTAA